MFGNIVNYKRQGNKVIITFEYGQGTIEVISGSILNIFSPVKSIEHCSRAIENLNESECRFTLKMDGDMVIIDTGMVRAVVGRDLSVDFYDCSSNPICLEYKGKRQPFMRRGTDEGSNAEGIDIYRNSQSHRIEIKKKLFPEQHIYGVGENTGHLSKRGYYYEMWNTDNPSPHVEKNSSMYKSVPFLISLYNNISYGIFFDNTYKTYFDLGKESDEYYYFASDDGNIDYYFIYGPEIKSVISNYTFLTGRTPLPQIWALGYQQSRWSYFPEKRVMEVARNFRSKGIPCDVIYLDIDYMDGYRVFTWDKERFPDPPKMIEELNSMGFKVVTIIDPGIKKDRGYYIYDEGIENDYFIKDKDGIPYVNKVWPGDALFPDFTQKNVCRWWANNQKIMVDVGVSGIWNDMNEPASFEGEIPGDVQFENDGNRATHSEIHNVYGLLMSKAAFKGIRNSTGKRPFVLTRACYSGIQKYSAVWTGDNHSMWEHLRLSIPMLLNLGLSGISFCGTDVGGFSFDCTGELMSRWIEVGCFSPFFRNHSSISTRDQEPWAFDKNTEQICKKYIKLRYKLLPYIYDVLWAGMKTGLPVMRPLVLEYQYDENTYEINDQFMVGEDILVAPIVEQGKKVREVYLPEGTWVDYWTKEVYEGKKYILKDAPLDICPVFIKQGSIIPNYGDMEYIDKMRNNELTFDIYPGDGEYVHYQDDGESYSYEKNEYNLFYLKMKKGENIAIELNIKKDGYDNRYKRLNFIVNNYNAKEVKVNGRDINFQNGDRYVEFNLEPGDVDIEII